MLTFIYSTVNAGKSANLLMRSHSCHKRLITHEILVPKIASDRDGLSKVSSRIGFKSDAISLDKDDCPFELIKSKEYKYQYIFVDEAQFLTKKQVYGLTLICDELKIPVFAYGLRTDFRGELFEGSKYLLAWCDKIEEISTFSSLSHGKAIFNMKVDANGNQVTDGDSISVGFDYLPVCRTGFNLKDLI